MAIAIWKDTYKTFSNQSTDVNYAINEAVQYPTFTFQGRAVNIPNTTNKVNVSRIVDNSFPQVYPVDLVAGNWTNSGALKTFNVIETGHQPTQYTFVKDWSYDDSIVYDDTHSLVLNKPINNKMPLYLNLYFGVYAPVSTIWKLEYIHSSSQSSYSTLTEIGSTAGCYNVTLTATPPYPVYYPNTAITDSNNNRLMEFILTDWNYAFLYQNRYGAFDSFIIEGNVSKTDSYDNSTLNKSFNNTTSQFNKQTIHNKITSTYTCATHYMTDIESELFAQHLVSSPVIYLLHKKSATVIDYIPVTIEETAVTHQIFRNGRKLPQYTITVKESQPKLYK